MRFGMGLGLGLGSRGGGGQSQYAIPTKCITAAAQEIRIGNSVESELTIVGTGTIASYQPYGGALVTCDAGTQTITVPAVADAGSSHNNDYVTITLAAQAKNDLNTVLLSNQDTIHYLNWACSTTGIGINGLIGALPTGLTYLLLNGSNITWTSPADYSLPTGLTTLRLAGNNITWTSPANYSLPTGLTFLYLSGNNITWTSPANYSLPTGLTYLLLAGEKINFRWNTDTVVNGSGAISSFELANYRLTNLVTGAELLNLLKSMATRKGGANGALPATCIVKEYEDSGNLETDPSPKVSVINAATPLVGGNTAQQLKYWIDKVVDDTGCNTLALSKA